MKESIFPLPMPEEISLNASLNSSMSKLRLWRGINSQNLLVTMKSITIHSHLSPGPSEVSLERSLREQWGSNGSGHPCLPSHSGMWSPHRCSPYPPWHRWHGTWLGKVLHVAFKWFACDQQHTQLTLRNLNLQFREPQGFELCLCQGHGAQMNCMGRAVLSTNSSPSQPAAAPQVQAVPSGINPRYTEHTACVLPCKEVLKGLPKTSCQ